MALDTRLVDLAHALRGHGVVVGTSDVIDAGLVVEALGLDERERLREGLASALLRRAGQREVFDALFDVHFPAALGARTALADSSKSEPTDVPTDARGRRERAAALRAELETALAAHDARLLDELAARTVAELGRLDNASTLGSFSANQAISALAPQTAIAGALHRMQDAAREQPGGSGDGSGGSGGSGSGVGGTPGGGPPTGVRFADRFTRDELRREVAAFRRRVESETRRRNAESRGRERIGRYAVRPPVEDRPFLLSGASDVSELRATVAPLARVLATRIAARRRRAARGTIDIRRTLRASLGTGGIPVRPAYHHRPPGRPDIVLLCDLSQSVAGFSRFTILLMQALAGQFRRVRVFGFVNVCDELTDVVVGAAPGEDLTRAFDDTARMTRYHRNSDYGTAFEDFAERYLDAVGHRTAVLILGDARSNGSDPGLAALREIVERARHVSWLNPEPARTWGTGDSVAYLYAEVVDMHECANARQLRTFVTRLLPV